MDLSAKLMYTPCIPMYPNVYPCLPGVELAPLHGEVGEVVPDPLHAELVVGQVLRRPLPAHMVQLGMGKVFSG